jgi:hypothetical protein
MDYSSDDTNTEEDTCDTESDFFSQIEEMDADIRVHRVSHRVLAYWVEFDRKW